jgi:hypothetical protein
VKWRAKRTAAAAQWLCALVVFLTAISAGGNPFESTNVLTPRFEIDRLVLDKDRGRNMPAAKLCSDAVFVRRVYLDVTGTLPNAFEAQRFLTDRTPTKRGELINRLLFRPEYADYLAMKWGDILRIKAEFPVNLWPNAAQAYYGWLRRAIGQNKRCDEFARELLIASGSNFDKPPVNFYRAIANRTPTGIAQAVALTFLGQRAERWPSNQLANLAVFFANIGYKSTAEWKEEIVFFNQASTNAEALNGSARSATLPDGTTVLLAPDRDPREVFAAWLVRQPGFARNLVNRAWFWLLGRGIVHEPDDIRPDNPPSNPQLLDYLEKEFISSGYDFKPLYRMILNSETYQTTAICDDHSAEGAANSACYQLRRLEAEVLIDAIDQITGTNEHYTSAIPEPYTVIPDNLKSVALPDGSITSSFLEMFGRPSRDTGLESERNNRISPSQKLYLLNSSEIQRKLESSRMIAFQSSSNRPPAEIVRGMYLGILSRFPSSEEIAAAESYFQSGTTKRQAATDLAWALMNSNEFLYRH